ncbi:MAG: thioredoxin domain-containing protein [Candidatus Chisholmbacteria bacterium]|nr:thioredoxin domain-containing protein [Candidatus Chisholmbacteria bacterium]
MQNTKVVVGIVLASLVLLVAGAFLFQRQGEQVKGEATAVADPERLVREDDYTITATASAEATESGETRERVQVVEFADFQCPACKAAYPPVKQMLETYGDEVTFVFRHFPLRTTHKNAFVAALAAEAAGAQGKFWEMNDVLFERQKEWEDSGDPVSQFADYAAEIELDVTAFRQSVEIEQFADRIDQDVQDGFALGVNSTPTFFVNGKKVTGALTTAQWQQLIGGEINLSD